MEKSPKKRGYAMHDSIHPYLIGRLWIAAHPPGARDDDKKGESRLIYHSGAELGDFYKDDEKSQLKENL